MSTKIHIPTPCSEDWSKMTPTDKGAFCDKCAFEVIDFTNQSPEEIRDTLRERSGQRTCGHISKVQMELVNTNYHHWENQTVKTFRSKFLYACIMVFGMALFTSCDNGGEEHVNGEITVEDPIDVGTVVEDDVLLGDTISCDMPVDGKIEPMLGEFDEEPIIEE